MFDCLYHMKFLTIQQIELKLPIYSRSRPKTELQSESQICEVNNDWTLISKIIKLTVYLL